MSKKTLDPYKVFLEACDTRQIQKTIGQYVFFTGRVAFFRSVDF